MQNTTCRQQHQGQRFTGLVRRILLVALTGAAILAHNQAFAEKTLLPKWEAGIGAVSATFPFYPGSDQNETLTLPIPFFVYRGDFLRADREGVRGVFFETDRLEINASFNGTLPVDNDNNDAREGMPDLDALIEFGPSVKYSFIEKPVYSLRLLIPIRAAISVGDSLKYQGLVFNPKVRLSHSGWVKDAQVNLAFGGLWGWDGVNDYFYEVDAEFATRQRPAYRARDGYIGSELSASVIYQLSPRLRLFCGANWLSTSRSANNNSPLHLQDNNYSFAAGFVYSLVQSQETVFRSVD